MPVHIEDHHVNRNAERAHLLSEADELKITVLPVTAPPVSEGVFRREGNLTADLHEIGNGSLVVVSVSEHVEILAFTRLACSDPVFPVGLHRNEDVPVALVDDGPAVAGCHSPVEDVPVGGSVIAVEGTGGSEQVAAVVHSRMPGHRAHALLCGRIRHRECHAEIVLVELAVSGICQCQCGCPDGHLPAGFLHCILRHRHLPVHNSQCGPVLELAVLSPFHADETVSEHCEAGISSHYHCLRVCERVLRCGRIVAELLHSEKPADEQRVIGGDAVHSETYHCPDILLLVHGPDIHGHSEVVGFGHPLRMLVYHIVMIVDSVDALPVKLRRGDVAVEILVGELRSELCNPLAHVHAEGYEHHPGRVVEAVLPELLQGQVNEGILLVQVGVLLELDHENGFREFLPLGEILVEGRHRCAVGELELFQKFIGVPVNALALDAGVVMHDDLIVRGKMDVKLRTPEAIVLGSLEGADGILGPFGRITIPEAAVSGNADAAHSPGGSRKRYQRSTGKSLENSGFSHIVFY